MNAAATGINRLMNRPAACSVKLMLNSPFRTTMHKKLHNIINREKLMCFLITFIIVCGQIKG